MVERQTQHQTREAREGVKNRAPRVSTKESNGYRKMLVGLNNMLRSENILDSVRTKTAREIRWQQGGVKGITPPAGNALNAATARERTQAEVGNPSSERHGRRLIHSSGTAFEETKQYLPTTSNFESLQQTKPVKTIRPKI